MPASLGAPEILVILVIALIVLGPNKLPEAARHIGKAMSEVRRWSQHVQSEIRDVIDVDPDPPAPSYSPPSYTPPPPAADPPGSAADPPSAAGDPPPAHDTSSADAAPNGTSPNGEGAPGPQLPG